ADRDRLGRALHRARPAHGNAPDLGEEQEAIIQPGATVVSDLWVGEAVVAVASLEAGIARRLPFPDARKRRLKCSVYAEYDILQDLGVDFGVFGHSLLDAGQLGLLLIGGDRDATHPPRLAQLANGGVVDVTAEHQRALKFPLVSGCGPVF